jgi:O-antigen/teichoic acid export membrane protein
MIQRIKQIFLQKLNINDARTKNVMKGSFSMVISTLIGNLTRMGLIMILSRYYSKEEFGIWATVTSTAAVIAYGDFGITNALRNKLSQLIVLGNNGLKEAKKYFYSAFIFFLFFSLFLSLLVLIISKFIPFDVLFKTDSLELKKQGVLIILWVQFFFFIGIPLSIGGASFFSFHESKYSAFFSIVQTTTSFLIVIVFTILNLSIVTISIAYFVSSTLINGVGTIYFLKRRGWFHYKFIWKDFYSHIKELISTGIKFMGFQLSNSFLQNAGTILASSFLGLSIAAEYSMVQKLYAFFSGIYQSMFNPIWGGYAEAAAKKDWRWCKKTLNVSLIATILIFSVAIIVLYFLGNYFLLFIAGKGYVSEKILFLLLGLTSLFFILFSTSTIFQNATSTINLLLASTLIACLLIFPISKMFMTRFGINGIAVSTSLIWLVLTCILTAQSYYLLNKKIKTSNQNY